MNDQDISTSHGRHLIGRELVVVEESFRFFLCTGEGREFSAGSALVNRAAQAAPAS